MSCEFRPFSTQSLSLFPFHHQKTLLACSFVVLSLAFPKGGTPLLMTSKHLSFDEAMSTCPRERGGSLQGRPCRRVPGISVQLFCCGSFFLQQLASWPRFVSGQCREKDMQRCVLGCEPPVNVIKPDYTDCDTWKCLVYCSKSVSTVCFELGTKFCQESGKDNLIGAGENCDVNCGSASRRAGSPSEDPKIAERPGQFHVKLFKGDTSVS